MPLDAALVGYLPSSRMLRELAGPLLDSDEALSRLKAMLFPGNEPRWLERTHTPTGVTGFIVLPWTVEALASMPPEQVAREAAGAVRLAGARGARVVSLAGMLPAWTGYGALVRPLLSSRDPLLTTGHAATVASIVATVRRALGGRDLAGLKVACVGLGSIGRASIRLLIETLGPPRSLVLCDRRGAVSAWEAIEGEMRAEGVNLEPFLPSDGPVPAAVYEADLIVLAVSTGGILEPDRLKAGAIVVDDSFPPAFSWAAARRRMESAGDVLLVGGGLLDVGPVERVLEVEVPAGLSLARLTGARPGVPSCQAESLLLAGRPELPRVEGPVSIEAARRWARAMLEAGWTAAPLHLGEWVVPDMPERGR